MSLSGQQEVRKSRRAGKLDIEGFLQGVSVVAWQILSSHNELFNARLYCVMKC